MNKQRITPSTNPLREYLVRWANESERGERFARWIGKAAGGLQFRLKMRLPEQIPWTPLKRPLSEATIAIIATGGIHCCDDKPFNPKSDSTYRAIPRTATSPDLCITHERYDRRDAARDLNLVFPLQRLLELEAEGVLGRVADIHYSFGFTDNPQELIPAGRRMGSLLAQSNVDLTLLVPA
jgi:D-proline reductase (dithiol) PrdB